MLKLTVRGVEVCVSVGFPAVVTLLCFFDKTGSAALCLAAACLHEAAHIAACLLCGFRPHSLRFGAFGMRMELPPLPYRNMAAVTVAGPLCNLVLAGLSALCGAAVSATVQLALGCFNLLPFRPLDGGQTLFCLLAPPLGEGTAERVVTAAGVIAILPLVAAALFLLFSTGYNVSLVILCVYLLFLLFFKKKD